MMNGMPTMMDTTRRSAALYFGGILPWLIQRSVSALSSSSGESGFGRGAAGLEGLVGRGTVVAFRGSDHVLGGMGLALDGVEGVGRGIGARGGGGGAEDEGEGLVGVAVIEGCGADDGVDVVVDCGLGTAWAVEGVESTGMGCSMTTFAAPPVGSTISSTGDFVDGGLTVPVLYTSSNILLVDGVTGVGLSSTFGVSTAFSSILGSVVVFTDATVFAADFDAVAALVALGGFAAAVLVAVLVVVFVVVFVVFAAFFGTSSFFVSAATFVLAFLTVFLGSAAGASSLTTFLGRPRFLGMGSVATAASILLN